MDPHGGSVSDPVAHGVRLTRATVYAATHRAETDVPLIGGQVFFRGGMWRDRKLRLHFTAREDMFDRGFFAGFPPDLSLRARRLLYPDRRRAPTCRVSASTRCPTPSANVLRVGKALEELPADTELAAVLPDDLLERIGERAHEAGLAPPRVARDALRGEFADLLWTMLPRDRLDSPLLEEIWTRRAIGATEQVRNAVELVRSGAPTLFFPEGRPSPTAASGRFAPAWRCSCGGGSRMPYARWRSRTTLSRAGAPTPISRSASRSCPRTTTSRRRCSPRSAARCRSRPARWWPRRSSPLPPRGENRLTTDALDAAFAGACDDATGQGRAYEPAWREAAGRRARLTDAMRFLVRAGLAHADGRRALVIDTARVLADDRLRRAAREYASAREAPAS